MKSNLTYLKKLELFKELDNFKDGQFFAIADQKIKNHLPQWIAFSPHIFWLKNPEDEKNLEAYGEAIEFLLKQGISRSSTLYVFGGGATTDFGGFVASTILRGIKWVAIPTTLLAMIDGSIGGKVALNTARGKNLIGSFHCPEKVMICGDFLSSLPDKEWISGKGEILKYGFLSKDIFDLILKKSPIEEIALACAKYKNEVVERDFRESGERILLNLGHTLGHAFETTLKIPHGQAVGMGLKYLFKIMNLNEALQNWELLVSALKLPEEKFDVGNYSNFDLKSFVSFIEHDKKKTDTNIRLVLVNGIGLCYVEEVSMKDFKTKIQSYAEFKT
jgi:3-dehydroquinate synthase